MRKQHTHLSDEALVALVARGDEDALAELYDRVGRVAFGLAFRVLRDVRHAEDAVQEAFLSVWRSAASFRAERAKVSTWILTLVHRRAVDLVRREERRRVEPLPDEPGVAGEAQGTEEAAWLRFERERVQAALEQLPDAQREAIELAYMGVEPVERARRYARRSRSRARSSRVLVDPAARTVSLQAGQGRLVVDPRGQAVLVLDGLDPAPTGKTYEMWIVPGGDIELANRAGLFPGRDGAEIEGLDGMVRNGDVVAVTVEKAGGVDAPTTAPIVASDPV
jgi:RNA polymerase sigma factor (sigma-70 family)